MPDYQICHSTIDADISPGNKPCLFKTKEQNHVGNIHPARGLVRCFRNILDLGKLLVVLMVSAFGEAFIFLPGA